MDLLKFLDGCYRKIGIWHQFAVYSEQEIVNVIREHLGFKNIGISVCAYDEDTDEQILLFLPFDFDSENIYKAWNDAKKLYEKLVDMGIECMMNYSGKKGFHVLVKTVPKQYPKRQISAVHQFFRDVLGLETIDEKLFGDISRLIRIPSTYNINGTWCRTLAENDGYPLDLDDLPVEYRKFERHQKFEYGNVEFDRPCIEWLIDNKDYWFKKRGKYEPEEPVRLTWAAIRLWRGDSIEDIIEEARGYGWDDFDSEYIQRKLEYLDAREWNPHSCDSLKALGYCLPHIICRKRNGRDALKELGLR